MTKLIVRLVCSMYSNATLFSTIKDYQLRLTKFDAATVVRVKVRSPLATVQRYLQYSTVLCTVLNCIAVSEGEQ